MPQFAAYCRSGSCLDDKLVIDFNVVEMTENV